MSTTVKKISKQRQTPKQTQSQVINIKIESEKKPKRKARRQRRMKREKVEQPTQMYTSLPAPVIYQQGPAFQPISAPRFEEIPVRQSIKAPIEIPIENERIMTTNLADIGDRITIDEFIPNANFVAPSILSSIKSDNAITNEITDPYGFQTSPILGNLRFGEEIIDANTSPMNLIDNQINMVLDKSYRSANAMNQELADEFLQSQKEPKRSMLKVKITVPQLKAEYKQLTGKNPPKKMNKNQLMNIVSNLTA